MLDLRQERHIAKKLAELPIQRIRTYFRGLKDTRKTFRVADASSFRRIKRNEKAEIARFINRSPWDLGQTLSYNIENIRIDGRMFEQLTGRSAVV